jgi:hypothetical protein
MADPSFANDIPEAAPVVAEPEDWAGANTRKTFRLLALFILPSIFLLLCVVAVFLLVLPRLKAGHLTAAAPAVAAAPADKDAEIAALQGQVANLQNQLLIHQAAPAAAALPGGAAVTGPMLAADSAALTQLSARLDRVEANQRALAHAASAAAAADALQGAADSGAPFATELALVQSQLVNPHLLDPVRPFAERGIPSRVALATQFAHVAATANIAAKAANGDKGPLAQLRHSLGAFISVRRIDAAANGVGVEATLAHAEAHIDAGDLAGAVGYLNSLPVPAQAAIKPWLDQARARVALDAATRRISEQALGALGAANAEPAAGGVL